MKLGQISQALDHKIVGGSDYTWNCYGPNVRYLDFEGEHAYASVLFSADTQQIFEATVDFKDGSARPYRWLNPETKQDYIDEAKSRGVNPNTAWDGIDWIDLELEEDFIEKASAIMEGKSFDQRIQVPLDLEDHELLHLALEAHKRDITMNQLVAEMLQRAIDNYKNK